MTRRRGSSRTGTFLVLAGIAGVLSATFVAGVWTGHHWPVIVGNPKAAASAEPSPAPRQPSPRPRRADTLPALTFYDELTAPLTAPPPPQKRPRAARPAEPRKAEPTAADGTSATGREQASPAPGERFTIQVGAYSTRPPAETLRASLAEAGHDARVVATESGPGVRYRVQVGTFSTREAARESALRLAAERSQPAFVTTR
jgi:cell division protein FtsN